MTKSKKLSTDLQLVSFFLDKEIFAVDVMKVQSVERIMEITGIPGLPDFVEGVINLRESIIPIVDLRKKFSLPPKDYGKETRTIIMELASSVVVGMIVDKVNEVFQIRQELLGSVPSIAGIRGNVPNDYINGVAKYDGKLIIVLDAGRIFSEEEEEAMKNV
ncbi:chemotaxis protein CheW [bacterium]